MRCGLCRRSSWRHWCGWTTRLLLNEWTSDLRSAWPLLRRLWPPLAMYGVDNGERPYGAWGVKWSSRLVAQWPSLNALAFELCIWDLNPVMVESHRCWRVAKLWRSVWLNCRCSKRVDVVVLVGSPSWHKGCGSRGVARAKFWYLGGLHWIRSYFPTVYDF